MLLRHGGQQGRYALRRALGRRKRHHAGHRVGLVRHGGRTAASRLGRLCQLADLILAHQGNIPGDFPKAADQQAQLATPRQPFVALGMLGARVPAQVTAAGMLLLSLRDRHGDVLGALSVTMPMGHESGEDAVRRVLSVLSETAQAMRNLI